MTHGPDDAQQRADELRTLAGPVNGDEHAHDHSHDHDHSHEHEHGHGHEHGSTAVGGASGSGVDPGTGDAARWTHEPDARTDPEIDDIRADEDDVVGDEGDAYHLRSMGVQPNPSEQDPASFLNP